MTDKLNGYDIEVLQLLAGERSEVTFGRATLFAVLEYLQGRRFAVLERTDDRLGYQITDAGRTALERSRANADPARPDATAPDSGDASG